MYDNDTYITSTNASHYIPSLLTGVAVITADGLIAIVGTLGNLLVLTVIFVHIRFSTVSNILIANLASVDLLTACVLIPGDMYRHVCDRMGYCDVDKTVVLMVKILAQFVVTAASTSLFVIAAERFIAIAFPFRYKTLFTRRRAIACAVLTWVLGAIITGVFNGLNIVYIQIIYCIFLILVTFFLYIYIFSIAFKHEKKIASMQVDYYSRTAQLPWESKSAKTMAIVLGVYALCWVPSVAFYSVVQRTDWIYPRMHFWMKTVYYLNAALDPFIYCVRSEKFRKSVKRLVKH
ncbi:alpha-1A adrenergic receptor-like [Oculina patagonica]